MPQISRVTVYSTPTCGKCKKIKDYLKEKEILFDDVDLAKNPELIDDFAKEGIQTVPIVEITYKKKTLVDFDQSQLEAEIKELLPQ